MNKNKQAIITPLWAKVVYRLQDGKPMFLSHTKIIKQFFADHCDFAVIFSDKQADKICQNFNHYSMDLQYALSKYSDYQKINNERIYNENL